METVEEALQIVKEIHGDEYYYLAIEGECPDLSELEPYQKVCSLGIKGYYCLMEDKAKDIEDNLDIILDNKHELETTSSDWQTTNGEPLEKMFGIEKNLISFEAFSEIFTIGLDLGFEELKAQKEGNSEGCNLELLIQRQYEKYLEFKK